MVVSLPIRTDEGVFKSVMVRVHQAPNKQIFLCCKVYNSDTIIITILM
jgi:hypothetical protein